MTDPRARWRHAILLGVLVSSLNVPARAESPPAQCSSDDGCGAGGRCDVTLACIPPEQICATSDDCAESWVCGHAASNCPTVGTETACPSGARGRCVAPLEHPCSMDAECADDELCYAVARPTCADGDGACDARPPGICVSWALVCDADTSCASEQTCIEARCVSAGAEDERDEIVVDEERTARLHADWSRGRGGCAVAAGASHPWMLLTALAALGLTLARRRR